MSAYKSAHETLAAIELEILIAEKYSLPIEAVPLEMLDFLEVVAIGAKKYAMNNWLQPDGKRSTEKDMHDSMGHHWAQSLVEGPGSKDKDSQLDPLLHLACRAMMLYTRRKRGIAHTDDLHD